MKANWILTQDRSNAIAAIDTGMLGIHKASQEYQIFQQVTEQIRDGKIEVFQDVLGGGPSYLGGQYKYVSKKPTVGEVTYFLGVKNDQLCIGTVNEGKVTELDEGSKTTAMNKIYKRLNPIKSTANVVGRAVSNVGASLTKQSSTIFPQGRGGELDEEDEEMQMGIAASDRITITKSGDDEVPIPEIRVKGRVSTKTGSVHPFNGDSLEEELVTQAVRNKPTPNLRATVKDSSVVPLREDVALSFMSGIYKGVLSNILSGQEITDPDLMLLTDPGNERSIVAKSPRRRKASIAEEETLLSPLQLEVPLLSDDSQQDYEDENSALDIEDENSVVEEGYLESQHSQLSRKSVRGDGNRTASGKSQQPNSRSNATQEVVEELGDTLELGSPIIRKLHRRSLAPSQHSDQVDTGGVDTWKVMNDYCLARGGDLRNKEVLKYALENRSKFTPFYKKHEDGFELTGATYKNTQGKDIFIGLEKKGGRNDFRIGELQDGAIGGDFVMVVDFQLQFNTLPSGLSPNPLDFSRPSHLVPPRQSNSGGPAPLSSEALLQRQNQYRSTRVVADDMFSADDQSPQPNQSRQPNSRTSRVRPEDEQRPPYVAPNTRLGLNIKTANPANSDTGRGGFFTSKSPIQELVDAMQDPENTSGLGEATLTAFKTVVAHFARRKENAGLPKGINYIDQGKVGSGGNYRAFHYHDYDGRDIVLGFKSNIGIVSGDMEMKSEPFFGSPMLNFGEITAIDEREYPKFLLALQRQLNSPFHRIAEVDNLTLKAVVSDLTVSNLKLDLGGGLNLAPVAHTDANNAKVAAVTKQSGAEYSIVVKGGVARVEEPKTLTFKTGSTKSASSDVATDVEGRCRTFLKKKRTLEWMKEVALGDHHPDYTITNGVDTTDEEIQKIAFKQAMYDAFKESLSTMDDKTSINEGLAVDVTDKRGGFSYLQGVVKKHFGIDEDGHLLFLKQVPNQEWVVVQLEELQEEDIDTLIEVMGFDKAKLKEVFVDKTQELEFEGDNYELEEEQFHQRPKGNASRLPNSLPSLQHPNQRQGGGAPRPTSFASNQQQGGRPSSAPSKPEAYQLKGELIWVKSYEKEGEVNVKQRGSKLIKSIVDQGENKHTVRNNIVVNAIVVAADKNNLTPAQALAIIEFSIEQRGFSNMRGFPDRVALANRFAEYVSKMPGGNPELDFYAMAKFSADFQRETTKAGLKREDSKFEGKTDGLNSSDIPREAIHIIKGITGQNNIISKATVTLSADAIQAAADKSNQPSYSR